MPEPVAEIGVAVRKSNPPHLGHLRLIETAARRVRRLFEDHTELTVSRVGLRWRLAILVAFLVGTAGLGWLLDTAWEDALHTYWDASIVAASVVAMVLMAKKKVESWWLWIEGRVSPGAMDAHHSFA